MRQLLFILALLGSLGLARAADSAATKTNSVALGAPGTLQIVAPADWTLVHTNLNLPDRAVTVELHSASNSIVIRFYIRWDGFPGMPAKPTEPEMGKIVSNTIVYQYLTNSVEKKFDLEKLRGPGVIGTFARITDAKWTPVAKGDTYPNLTEGMFRCGNIWGNFNVLTFGKDGPLFKEALKALESMRRAPPAR
jgi:hypothetical protein